MKVLAAVTVVAFLIALVRVPHAMALGIQHQRGIKRLAAGDAKGAVEFLQPISKEYPKNRELQLDLTDAYAHAGMYPEASRELMTFEGMMVTEEEEARLNQIESYLNTKLPRMEVEK